MVVKNAVLLGRAQACEQRQHLGAAVDRLVAYMFAQVVGRLTDFTLAGQEDQDVARVVRVAPEFVHTVGNRLVQAVVAAFFKRAVTLLHREHPARHHDHRRGAFFRLEVFGEAVGINGGRGHDDLQVGPARQNLAQVTQQKVDVQAAFVGLVDDDGVVRVQ